MFKKKDKKTYDDDDGRVIAPMNVEGMPWHRMPLYRKGKQSDSPNNGESHDDSGSKQPPLTKREALVLILNGALAGLTIALILGAIGALFILFLTNVWFR